VRYRDGFQKAIEHYRFLRSTKGISLLRFYDIDETSAVELLTKYAQHALSYHDALCAAVMLRHGIPNFFSFDRDSYTLVFVVLPGRVAYEPHALSSSVRHET
jgi:predicted nucleic acid-binding protein